MPHNERILKNGERLFAGQFLTSSNGLFHALMQDDGNFVVYRGDIFKTKPPGYEKTALWSVFGAGEVKQGAGDFHLFMQTDGNLCIYRQQPNTACIYANEQTASRRAEDGRVLDLGDDGRLDIRGIWNSGAGDSAGEIEFERVDYILDPQPVVVSVPRASVVMNSRNSSDSKGPKYTFKLSAQDTHSSSWKTSTSLKIGAKTTVEAGIPGLVDGNVQTSIEGTQSFEFNKTDSKTETKTFNVEVQVSPHMVGHAKVVWIESSYSMPYRAIGKVKFGGWPDKLPVQVEGSFAGVATTEFETLYKETPDLPGGAMGSGAASAAAVTAAVTAADPLDLEGWGKVPWTEA